MRIVITKQGKIEIIEDSNNSNKLILPPIRKNIQSRSSERTTIKKDNQNIDIPLSHQQSLKKISLKRVKVALPSFIEQRYTADSNEQQSLKNPMIINSIESTLTESNLPIYKREFSLKELISKENQNSDNNKVNLNKGIKIENWNLISYLTSKKKINMSYIGKISNLPDEGIFKLNKICQKHQHSEEVGSVMKNVIKKKIKWKYANDSDYCKHNLVRMKKCLNAYKSIFCKLQEKRENYLSNRENFLYFKSD